MTYHSKGLANAIPVSVYVCLRLYMCVYVMYMCCVPVCELMCECVCVYVSVHVCMSMWGYTDKQYLPEIVNLKIILCKIFN